MVHVFDPQPRSLGYSSQPVPPPHRKIRVVDGEQAFRRRLEFQCLNIWAIMAPWPAGIMRCGVTGPVVVDIHDGQPGPRSGRTRRRPAHVVHYCNAACHALRLDGGQCASRSVTGVHLY